MKTITHIDTQRTEGIVSPLLVQQSFSFSEMEYKQFVYELGVHFLKEFYVEDTLAIAMVERSVYFWKWFKNEYLRLELILFEQIQQSNRIVDKDLFMGGMKVMIIDPSPFESYLTFLKIYKDKLRCQNI